MFSAVMTGSEGTQSGTASKTLFSADSISTAGFHFARPYHKDTEERPWHPHKDHIVHVSPFAVEYVYDTISDWKHSQVSLDWLKKTAENNRFPSPNTLTSLLRLGLHRIVCVLLFLRRRQMDSTFCNHDQVKGSDLRQQWETCLFDTA